MILLIYELHVTLKFSSDGVQNIFSIDYTCAGDVNVLYYMELI